jgi:putative oxidoreductase
MNTDRESKLEIIVRWILGVMLAGASLSKIANPQEFFVSMAAYQTPLPAVLLRLAAMILPWLELLCGLLLLGRIWMRPALVWSLVMFAVFVVMTGQAWARGLEISCGCFNLKAFGLDPTGGKPFVKFIESVGVAFVRALLLFLGAFYLFRSEGRTGCALKRTVTETAPLG